MSLYLFVDKSDSYSEILVCASTEQEALDKLALWKDKQDSLNKERANWFDNIAKKYPMKQRPKNWSWKSYEEEFGSMPKGGETNYYSNYSLSRIIEEDVYFIDYSE